MAGTLALGYVVTLAVGLSAVAIVLALRFQPTEETDWLWLGVWWTGRALIALGLLTVAGLIVGAVAALAARAVGAGPW